MSWFNELFIKQVKPALDYHNGMGFGSGSSDDTQMYILMDEEGNEYPAVLVNEETVFDATANDIREGKVAATESGVTVGTREIPAYITTEGIRIMPAGSDMTIKLKEGKHAYTKLQAVICAYNTNMTDSTAVEKTCINDNVYPVMSVEPLSTIVVDDNAQAINLGIVNENSSPVIIRFFTYKEEH